MSEPHPAVEAVRAKALASWQKGNRYSVATDPYTFAGGKRPSVLIAIATRAQSIVLAMDMTDWLSTEELAAVMIMEFVGFAPATVDTHGEAVQAKAEVLKNK